MIRSAVFAILLATSASPITAAEIQGRYVLEKVEDGYLWLDGESGSSVALRHSIGAVGMQVRQGRYRRPQCGECAPS